MKSATAICLMAALAFGVPAEAANAQAPTRDAWADRANDECAAVSPGNRKLIDRSLAHVEERKYTKAGRLWNQAWRRSIVSFREISRFDRPADDVERIQHWIDGELRALRVAIRSGDALGAGRVGRWDRLAERSARIDREAQRAVRDFPMPRCLSIDD